MKYLSLIIAGLWRKPTRTVFTFLSITVAFVLFGVLAGVNAGFARAQASTRGDRLFTDPRFGGTGMPVTYAQRIARVPGVKIVALRTNLPGTTYQDSKTPILVIPTDRNFFSTRPELGATKEQLDQWDRVPTGAILTAGLAKKYRLKVGDKMPLHSSMPKQDGSRVWTFDVTGIVDDAANPGRLVYMMVHYKYVDQERTSNNGTLSRILILIDDPNRVAQVSSAIDKLFANSPFPTRTTTDAAGVQATLQRLGDTAFFIRAVIAAVVFMMLFMTGSAMMQSIRERIPEFGVLKALGFSDFGVLALVFVEAIILCVLAALVGIAIGNIIMPFISKKFVSTITIFKFSWTAIAAGFGSALVVALISGLLPALRVKRLNVTDALAGR